MKRTVVKKEKGIKLTGLQLSAIRTCRGIIQNLHDKRGGSISKSVHYTANTLLDVAVKLSGQDASLYSGTLDALAELMGMYGDISGGNRAFAVSGIVEALLYPE